MSSRESQRPPQNGSSGAREPSEASGTAIDRDTHPSSDWKHNGTPRRKHKVIIHTSPFVRCVQTAIAISAGISQYRRTSGSSKPLYAGPPATRTSDSDPSPKLSSIPEPGETTVQAVSGSESGKSGPGNPSSKTLLRIDAFLGEWLCPDYYEQITPPPSSVMMVAGAKAELLRRGEEIHRGHDAGSRSISGYFPGGWGSPLTPVSPEGDDNGGPRPISAMAYAMGQRNRTGSYDASMGNPLGKGGLSKIRTDVGRDGGDGYIPPTPTYAVSPSDPIPTGYVAHARDACVEVDYQWDSMREPQNWGDGGEYGEEWSAMHQRFRNGLENMIDWYRTHDRPHEGHHGSHPDQENHSNHNHDREGAESPAREDEDDVTDVVLILVTHGAGCNALIGALTSQPVLLDVGMASLTMAVRKDMVARTEGSHASDQQQDGSRRRSSIDGSMYREYEMKLVASSEHLRAGSTPLRTPQQPSPKILRSPSISSHRHRLGSEAVAFGDSTTRGHGSNRSATTKSRPFQHVRGGSGLWGSFSASEAASESSEDIVPNFEEPRPASSSRATDPTWAKRMPEQTKSQRGLWGSATIAQEREPATKRRWTVAERHD